MRTRPLLFAALLSLPFAFAPAPALADSPTLRIDVDNDHGKDVHLTVNGGLLGTIVEAMAPHATRDGVSLPGGCWLVGAKRG